MGAHATFDPVEKLITLITAPVDNAVSLSTIADLYSDAKEDWKNIPSLRGFALPFRVIGGDDLGSGLSAGAYFFLRNDLGWKIKPYEADHDLTISGNLYPNDTAIPIFIPTTGAFTVSVRLSTSSLTQQVTGSGADEAAIADAVRVELTPELTLIDASVASRATQASVDALATALAGSPKDTWDYLLSNTFPAGSTGERLKQVLTTGNFMALSK